MSIHKDNATGKWRVVYRYTDWTGETHQSSKRGFPTKREAQMWERELLLKKEAKLDMTFESFYEIYVEDMQNRIRDNTWGTKTNIARTKILPYFGKRKIGEIEPRDIIAWQNELLAIRQPNGKPYSASYLQKIHSQLSAIFNHAVNFYHLPSNPAQKAGNMGKEEHREMLFWTKEEYLKFADAMMDKPVSYYAFEILYWCGLRMGELLALTPADFNFETHTLRINKSYQRLHREDVITPPKTLKSNKKEFYDYLYGLEYVGVSFKLKMGGRDLEELSPGERGIVLLIFYLALSQNSIPIIIDQPEDNLDNQSVYNKLVPCICAAKQKRQVIIVTHNPNIAVACDAEQIICCKMDKNTHKITYLSGAIEDQEIKQNVVDILEGTMPAFDLRRRKYV